jgi:hypothetical protein
VSIAVMRCNYQIGSLLSLIRKTNHFDHVSESI